MKNGFCITDFSDESSKLSSAQLPELENKTDVCATDKDGDSLSKTKESISEDERELINLEEEEDSSLDNENSLSANTLGIAIFETAIGEEKNMKVDEESNEVSIATPNQPIIHEEESKEVNNVTSNQPVIHEESKEVNNVTSNQPTTNEETHRDDNLESSPIETNISKVEEPKVDSSELNELYKPRDSLEIQCHDVTDSILQNKQQEGGEKPVKNKRAHRHIRTKRTHTLAIDSVSSPRISEATGSSPSARRNSGSLPGYSETNSLQSRNSRSLSSGYIAQHPIPAQFNDDPWITEPSDAEKPKFIQPAPENLIQERSSRSEAERIPTPKPNTGESTLQETPQQTMLPTQIPEIAEVQEDLHNRQSDSSDSALHSVESGRSSPVIVPSGTVSIKPIRNIKAISKNESIPPPPVTLPPPPPISPPPPPVTLPPPIISPPQSNDNSLSSPSPSHPSSPPPATSSSPFSSPAPLPRDAMSSEESMPRQLEVPTAPEVLEHLPTSQDGDSHPVAIISPLDSPLPFPDSPPPLESIPLSTSVLSLPLSYLETASPTQADNQEGCTPQTVSNLTVDTNVAQAPTREKSSSPTVIPTLYIPKITAIKKR